jgi:hypothetical protein
MITASSSSSNVGGLVTLSGMNADGIKVMLELEFQKRIHDFIAEE